MKIDAGLVKKLRKERQWSQEQLAEASGLNLRTVQRLENEGKASLESVRALAAVFEVNADQLMLAGSAEDATPLAAVRTGFLKATDFSGTASRSEYWWFLLSILLVLAVATVIGERLFQIAALILLLPLLAGGTRRLRDAGHSGWWQLLFLAPFGQLVVLFLLAMPGRNDRDKPGSQDAKAGSESQRSAGRA